MDQLVAALAKAIEAGADLAFPAVIGYFIVKSLWPLSVVAVFFVIVRGAVKWISLHYQGQTTALRIAAIGYMTKHGPESLPFWAHVEAVGPNYEHRPKKAEELVNRVTGNG